MSLKIKQILILILILLGYVVQYQSSYLQSITIGNQNVSEYLTIVFGITSVIGTLVGLITIFASLDVQHKMDKSKELLWTLKDLHSDNQKYKQEDLHRQLVKLLRAYDYASSYEEQKSMNIIGLAKSTLLIIYLIWVIVVFALIIRYSVFEFYSVLLILIIVGVLLFRYYNYLEQLRDFRTMSGLPTISQMLDASYEKGLKGLSFASVLLSANLINGPKNSKGDERLLLTISVSPPIYNFSLLVDANYYKDAFNERGGRLPINGELITKNNYLRIIRKKNNFGLDYSTHYKVAVLKLPADYFDTLEITFTLLSEQGIAEIKFMSITREQLKRGEISFRTISDCHPLSQSKNSRFEERQALLAKKDVMYLRYNEGRIREFAKRANEVKRQDKNK